MDFNLDRLRTFLVVARTGNLSATARELGATQPNVGRQMAALEKEVGLTLFIRHSRGLDLTTQGQQFRALCENVVGQIAQGVNIIREKDSNPKGILKIITGIGTTEAILENLPKFSQKFPDIDFIFLSTTEIYQLHIGDADVSIVPVIYNDPDIIQHVIYELKLRIYASPGYLKTHPLPKRLEDLISHKLIFYSGLEKINIHLPNTDSPLRHFITVNNGISLRKALLDGLGIGPYGYEKELVERGLLIDVFPDMPDHNIPYYYTYHKRLEGSPKVLAFHNFLKEISETWKRPDKQ